MDRHDVELETGATFRRCYPEPLGQNVAARSGKDQIEGRTRDARRIPLWALDPQQPQQAMPIVEAEQLIHMRSEILMPQDLGHQQSSVSLAGTTHSSEAPFPEGVTLRPETPQDEAFLFALFRDTALPELALMPVDDATKEALVRMQFASQSQTYRAQFPAARFDIVEQHGTSIGRIVVDDGEPAGCIVDFALVPGSRSKGLGTAILAAVMQHFVRLRRPARCKVLMSNAPSLRMCQRVGFQQIEVIPPFLQLEWQPPVSADNAPSDAIRNA
jgi:RimJ/RimL family protein N-acetyltransferase